MMSFCRKSVHSFLGLAIPINTNLDHSNTAATTNNNNNNNYVVDHHHKPKLCLPVLTTTASSGLGLITAADIDSYKAPPNVLESTAFKSSSLSCPPPSPPLLFKKDPGGIGFIDDVGGGVNGLMSCTESLGFESCDERRVDDKIDELCSTTISSSTAAATKVYNRKKNHIGERREVKKFPPPLSSLNHNGQPSFFLRPVRKDGRLELTEVRIDRPEILRASREGGRLRLHLIRDEEEDDEDEEEEEEEENQDFQQAYEAQENQESEQEEEFQETEGEGEITGVWRFPVTEEGFRRCHELVARQHHQHHGNHHHNLHVWSQHCVTTR